MNSLYIFECGAVPSYVYSLHHIVERIFARPYILCVPCYATRTPVDVGEVHCSVTGEAQPASRARQGVQASTKHKHGNFTPKSSWPSKATTDLGFAAHEKGKQQLGMAMGFSKPSIF